MWFGRRADSDHWAEIEAHIRLESDRLIAEGMPPAEAQAAARRSFGNVATVREKLYESARWRWWEQLGQDLRYGWRSLRKNPAFAAAAVLTIALGVGANTAVFSLVDAVLLQLLPVQEPKELVFIDAVGNSPPSGAPPYPCVARLPAETNSFTGLAIFASDELRIEIDGKPEQIFGQVASGNYFELLGVKPTVGRLMNAQDEKLGPPVAVISDRYWERRFRRDPAAIGKTIRFGDQTFTIAGVTPPEFMGLQPGRPLDMTFPINTSRSLLTYSGPWWFDVIARLKPGVSGIQAQAASNGVFQACTSNSRQQLELQSAAYGLDMLRRRFSRPLSALMGIAGLVLLLATVNIANLLLARGIARRREFAIRLATGAGRVRLVRQLLTETLLLFGLGAAPGIIFARWGVAVVETLFAQGRRPITLEANLNWRILAFSITVTLAAGLLSGLFPVWRTFRSDPEQAIREGQARMSESRSSATLMRALVGFQVALSLVLLVGAITFVRTLANLRDVDPGFRNEDVLTMSIELRDRSIPSRQAIEEWSRVLAAVRETPGVRAAGLCNSTPLSGRDSGGQVRIRGYQPASVEDSAVRVNHVSEGYFETLGIQLLRGRLLTERDAEGAPRVALINESAARKYFAERDPVGQTLEFDKNGTAESVYRIAGVVRDTKHKNLREPSPRMAFIPIRQPRDVHGRVTLTVASAAPNGQMALLGAIRSRLAGVDPGLFISEVITIRNQLDSTLLTERLLSGLSTAFGSLALILASVGLYGVLSYRIGQQRQSIGIRMALGASPTSVAVSVLGESGLVVGAGLLCGLPIAFLAARAAESMLWGVRSSDPAIYVAAATLLCLAGFASAWLPARRASAIEPAEALRCN